jgi:MYXO-CTERM domain-containing protein
VLTGTAATEAAVKAAHAPAILHIATHGFFLADTREGGGGKAGARALVLDTGVPPDTSILRTAQPLLRSGLLFAGANGVRGDNDDGVLTALEASGLELTGTQLVVLSACESGVGEVRSGDGVYGLRRAFVIAGSETQVMSLWKVDDDATRDLMVAFYDALRGGADRAAALRSAQQSLYQTPKYAHPHFWAAFILSGDPGPMSLPSAPTHGALPPGSKGCACDTAPASGGSGAAMVVGGLLFALAAARRARRSAVWRV